MIAPLILLGVSRSGTTMLRVILDRSTGIAIPDESFFVPVLARRHDGPVDPAAFLDDLSRLPALHEWGLSPDEVVPRLRSGMSAGEAIASVFEVYAEKAGKPRWGDKTPMYMRHLPLLDRLFPDAQYVHLIRDGRDAALSFLQMPEGTFTRTWAHPGSATEFACLWRTEVEAARELGLEVGHERYLEVRYEDVASKPEAVVYSICDFAGIAFEASMVDYAGSVDVSAKPHHRRLLEPPSKRRDWRSEMDAQDVRSFEAIAGDLLEELGYELGDPAHAKPGAGAGLRLRWYRVRIAIWKAAASASQRSPLWRRRHPRL